MDNNKLDGLRARLDGIDREIVDLLCRRMDTVADVAAYKKANGIEIYAPTREETLLRGVSDRAGDMSEYVLCVYREILLQSRAYQHSLNG